MTSQGTLIKLIKSLTATVGLDDAYIDELQETNSPKLADELKNNVRLDEILGSMESAEAAATKASTA